MVVHRAEVQLEPWTDVRTDVRPRGRLPRDASARARDLRRDGASAAPAGGRRGRGGRRRRSGALPVVPPERPDVRRTLYAGQVAAPLLLDAGRHEGDGRPPEGAQWLVHG